MSDATQQSVNRKDDMHFRIGSVYSASYILTYLERKHICFSFGYEGRTGVIQDMHLRDDDYLDVPGFTPSQWRLVSYNADADTFIFEYIGDAEITEMVDLSPYVSTITGEEVPDLWWATPKGCPRKQRLL